MLRDLEIHIETCIGIVYEHDNMYIPDVMCVDILCGRDVYPIPMTCMEQSRNASLGLAGLADGSLSIFRRKYLDPHGCIYVYCVYIYIYPLVI